MFLTAYDSSNVICVCRLLEPKPRTCTVSACPSLSRKGYSLPGGGRQRAHWGEIYPVLLSDSIVHVNE